VHPSAHVVHNQTANRSVQPFLGCSRQKVPIPYSGRLYPPELPIPMGDLVWTPSDTIPSAHASNWHLDRFCRFCTDDRRVFLYFVMVHSFPLQNCPFHGGSGPHVIHHTWFLGPTRVLNPNGNSIASTVFVGFTTVCDRLTERQTDRQTTLLSPPSQLPF